MKEGKGEKICSERGKGGEGFSPLYSFILDNFMSLSPTLDLDRHQGKQVHTEGGNVYRDQANNA